MQDSDFKKVQKFIGMIAAGSFLGIVLGSWLDKVFNTEPIFLLLLLGYAIFGSLYLLLKDLGVFRR